VQIEEFSRSSHELLEVITVLVIYVVNFKVLKDRAISFASDISLKTQHLSNIY
jgi:hypothetical protein